MIRIPTCLCDILRNHMCPIADSTLAGTARFQAPERYCEWCGNICRVAPGQNQCRAMSLQETNSFLKPTLAPRRPRHPRGFFGRMLPPLGWDERVVCCRSHLACDGMAQLAPRPHHPVSAVSSLNLPRLARGFFVGGRSLAGTFHAGAMHEPDYTTFRQCCSNGILIPILRTSETHRRVMQQQNGSSVA